MNITILGAGAFGTALGRNWALANHSVAMWCIESDVVQDINLRHRNRRYLKGVVLKGQMNATLSMEKALEGSSVVVVCVASQHIESVLTEARKYIPRKAYVVNASKGFVDIARPTIPELIVSMLPKSMSARIAQISGPSFAHEVASGEATVMSLGMSSEVHAKDLASKLSTQTLYIVPTPDVVGVALGGSMKNCYVIALGIMSEITSSINERSIIIDAALKEMSLLTVALGGNPSTLIGPSGVGDLVATGIGGKSRNLEFGRVLGRTGSIRRAKRSILSTVEGIEAIKHIYKLAKYYKLKMPLVNAIYRIVYQDKPPRDVLQKFLEQGYRVY